MTNLPHLIQNLELLGPYQENGNLPENLKHFESGIIQITYIGVIRKFQENEFCCYPHPFTKELEFKTNGTFRYSIYDLCGSEVESGEGENTLTAANSLLPGMYLVKIHTSSCSKFFKIRKVSPDFD